MARGVDLTWAGGEHHFCLPLPLLRAVQERCDAGPSWVLARLASKQWLIDDVVAPILYGLEGGGLSKDDARKLTRKFVEDDFGAKHVLTASAILMAALYSVEAGEDADAGERKAVGA